MYDFVVEVMVASWLNNFMLEENGYVNYQLMMSTKNVCYLWYYNDIDVRLNLSKILCCTTTLLNYISLSLHSMSINNYAGQR